jgi:hypothetical protein
MKLQTLRQRAFARELAPVAASIDMEETTMANDNTLGQLNIELFSELHRLREVDASDADALKAEVARSKAVEGIARTIVDNANTMLDVTRLRAEYSKQVTVPKMLDGE